MKTVTLDTTPTNAEEQTKQSYSLIDREEIENTPFLLVKTEHGYFLAIGNHRITELTKTREEQLEKIYSSNIDWLFLLTTVNAVNKITQTI